MSKFTRWISLVWLVMLLVGCAPPGGAAEPENPVLTENITVLAEFGFGAVLLRVVDREAGIVCWVASRSETMSVVCLPISETELRP